MTNSKKIYFFLCTILLLPNFILSKELKMSKKVISTQNAPQAIGPYSQAVKTGDLILYQGKYP